MKKLLNNIMAFIVVLYFLFMIGTGVVFLTKLAIDFWVNIGG